MTFDLDRRAFVAGAAALPFLRIPSARAAQAGMLTFGLSSYPPNLQPWSQSGTAAGTIKLLIHRGLLSYDAKGDYTPELAESWSNDTPTTWTFKLRSNGRFSDGSKVTSADVKWCIEQIAAEKSTAFFRSEFQGIASVETPDDLTVRMVTKEPVVTLPLWFANYNLPIVPKGSDLNQPIGAGPDPAQVQDLRDQLGLNRPLLAQYSGYLGGVLRGDLFLASGRPRRRAGDLAAAPAHAGADRCRRPPGASARASGGRPRGREGRHGARRRAEPACALRCSRYAPRPSAYVSSWRRLRRPP